jgi:hypothetical protein
MIQNDPQKGKKLGDFIKKVGQNCKKQESRTVCTA